MPSKLIALQDKLESQIEQMDRLLDMQIRSGYRVDQIEMIRKDVEQTLQLIAQYRRLHATDDSVSLRD